MADHQTTNNEPITSANDALAIENWPKHAVWLGLVTTIAGTISYFLYFAQFPSLRDFPIVNLPIVMLGLVLSGLGWWKILQKRGNKIVKMMATAGFLMGLGVAGLFNVYIFGMSYDLPTAATAPSAQEVAPDFTLSDHTDSLVSLSDYRGKKVVLVFYRGYW